MIETKLNKMYEKIESMFLDLETLKKDIEDLQAHIRYEKVKLLPGITGVFDGYNMVSEDGTLYKVPENYAVKSKIVYGDTLKLVKTDGKELFKHLIKLPRVKIEATVTKKEGSYYALTEFGDHKLSNTAVEYNKIKIGDRIQVRLPEDNLRTPFATFDKVILTDDSNASINSTTNSSKKVKNEQKNTTTKKETALNSTKNYSNPNSNIKTTENNFDNNDKKIVEVKNVDNLTTQNTINNSNADINKSLNYTNKHVKEISNTSKPYESNNYKPLDKDMNGYDDLV